MSVYTVDEMEALIRAALNEPSQARITSADILQVLNDGQKEVAIKALCIEKDIYLTAKEGETVIPVDCLKVEYVRSDVFDLFYSAGKTLSVPGVPGLVGVTTVIAETPIVASGILSVPGVPGISVAASIGAADSKSIGYTTQQMSVSGTQTLTVVDPQGGVTYSWTTSSGSIDATGESVTFTAPATNPECANNAIIALQANGVECDTLQIAVAGLGLSNIAAAVECNNTPAPWTGYHCYAAINCYGAYDCGFGYGVNCADTAPCYKHLGFATQTCAQAGYGGGVTDTRNAYQLSIGCCPLQLL